MLSHRSGISNHTHLHFYQERIKHSPDSPIDPYEILNVVLTMGPLFSAGKDFAYSNPGYFLLKIILEEIEKKTFANVLREKIIAPLKLTNTKVLHSQEELLSLTMPNSTNRFGLEKDIRGILHPAWLLHGFISSCGEDLNTFFNALLKDKLLPANLLKEMCTLQSPGFKTEAHLNAGYGLGIMGDLIEEGGGWLGHTGEGPGFSVATFYHRKKDLGVTVAVGKDLYNSASKIINENF